MVRLWRRVRRVVLRAVVRVANCVWVSGVCTLVVQRSFLVVLRLFVMI